ncbi:unnamed protein product [Victoria cruziana]
MAGKSAERELVSLFDEAKKAADLAASAGGSVEANEARCLDALLQLQEFPVNMPILVSTQVGKRLRGLTKHPRKKIQSKASELIELWKNVVVEETARNNKKSNSSLNSEGESSVKAGNQAERIDVVKWKNDKAEKSASRVDTLRDEKILKRESSEVDNLERPRKVVKVAKEDRELVTVKKASSSSVMPPKLSAMVKCNDPLRDKLREILVEAFTKVAGEADEDMIDEVNRCDPIRVAVAVESVMFEKLGRSNGAQKSKYRSIMFNLKDANNPDLRRKVLVGEVKPERLITMAPVEMASDRRKQENKQIQEKALFECERGGPAKATTDQFKCGRCGQRKTTYYQLQTRSADEPMTTFVTCVNCNNHWKFC